MSKIEQICLRNIINSNGKWAVEADVTIKNAVYGRASSPSAILAGKRERRITSHLINSNGSDIKEIIKRFEGKNYSQREWDCLLEQNLEKLGTDITLALSLAFARAAAKETGIKLVEYIRTCAGITPSSAVLCPLIPIFSGGVHDPQKGGSMQQIMLSVSEVPFFNAVDIILEFYSRFEKKLQMTHYLKGYAASSGFLTDNLNVEDELGMLTKAIEESGLQKHLSIAVDIAAEHLKEGSLYRFYNRLYTAEDLEKKLLKYVKDYPITYIEDPFDFNDITNWEHLHKLLDKNVKVFSDDLSATQICYIDEKNTDGVIVKMKQVGTLSSTLDLINKSRKLKLKTCISHRSIETEDTFMCDLGVAIGTDFMKIGGPRRGDRIDKYNRLLRIFSNVDYA